MTSKPAMTMREIREALGHNVPPEPETYPAQIGVFCDDCNLTFKGDFIVTDDMDSEARFEVARAHLRDEGWSCTADGDLCPTCAALREEQQ